MRIAMYSPTHRAAGVEANAGRRWTDSLLLGVVMSSFARLRGVFFVALIVLFVQPASAVAPTISGTPTTTATVGKIWSFTPVGADADSKRLVYTVINRPSFAWFSRSTGRLVGIPTTKHIGTYSNIVISVSDGTTKVSLAPFTLTVVAASGSTTNQPPTISGTPPTTATVGAAYAFLPTAADPEKKTLTFSVSGKPSWATFNTGNGQLSGTPATANVGTFSNITISVSDGTSSASLAPFTITVSATNSPPTIGGTPPTAVTVGSTYNFQPTAQDANNDTLTFIIANKPSWATFSTTTGRLTGTPTAANVGTTSGVRISVTDTKATTSLASFSITVSAASGGGTTTGAATLSWTPPTTNTDGTALTDLAGYRISYGNGTNSMTSTLQIPSPGITSAMIESLTSGTWYFVVKAYTSSGVESPVSSVVSKTIP